MLYFAWSILLTAITWKMGQTLAALSGKRWLLFTGSLLFGIAVYALAGAAQSLAGRIAVKNYDDYLLWFLLLAVGLTILAVCPEFCVKRRHNPGKAGLALAQGAFGFFCLIIAALAAAMLALAGDGNRPSLAIIAFVQAIAVFAFAVIFSYKGSKITATVGSARRAVDHLLLAGGVIALLLAFLVPALVQMRGAVFEPLAIPSLKGLGVTMTAMIACLLCGYIWQKANHYRR